MIRLTNGICSTHQAGRPPRRCRVALGRCRLPSPLQGRVSSTHRVRSPRVPRLDPRARLEPLEVRSPHIELYRRWMQEVRSYKPATVSRRLSILSGFYRTCVIDGVLEHSPAEHVRRPHVPPES